MASPLLKTLLFTLLVPGTVAGVVPVLLAGGLLGEMPSQPWRAAAGATIGTAGALLYLWCAWHFATTGKGTPSPTDPPRFLVARGPYRVSRNPMYVAVLTVIAGAALWSASRAVAIYLAAMVIVFHLRVILFEEPALRRAFAERYEEYVARVPRWVGWPR